MEFGNFESVQENGKVKFYIPNADFTGTFKASYIKSADNGDFYWYGPMEEDCEQDDPECGEIDEGLLSLIRRNGEITGTLRFNDYMYEIHDLGGGKNILVQKNFENQNLTCGNNSEESSGELEQHTDPNSNLSATTRDFNNCPVRVLALFTPAANAGVANIENTITLSIEEANQALRNSGVTECELELILADIQPINFTETIRMERDRDNLIQDPVVSQQVIQLRNNANADIVVVYVEGNYGINIGIAGTLTLEPERALCLIQASEANTEYNTAHEVAHLFACRHQPEADDIGPIEHAHNFKTGVWPFRKDRRTVMWATTTGQTIHHFSNPKVNFKNKSTGVEDEKENYRQLENNACVVAGFRGDDVTPPLSVAIDAPGFNCPCTSTGLNSQVSGGEIGIYQYEWRTSSDGFNWGNVVSTSSGYSLISPCVEGNLIYIRLTVTSSDGQVLDAYKAIESAYEWNGQEGACIRDEGENTNKFEDNKNKLQITPNPVNDIINIEVMSNNITSNLVQILDIHGKVVYEQALEMPVGIFRFTISVTDFPSGTYLIRIKGQNSKKFIKN